MKRSEPARAVVQFAGTGTCALLLLGFLAVTLLRNAGKSERAIRDARARDRLGRAVEAHQHLPGVLAPQHPEERAGRVLEAVDDRLAIADPALAEPGADLAGEVVAQVPVVADDEAPQGQPLADRQVEVAGARRTLGSAGVVLRDR